ncbi:MAG: signal peptidase I [Thermoanaerobaculia bacterium]
MRRSRSLIVLILEPLLIVAALALIARSALVSVYSIPSVSMAPTLQVGDHILVTSYRLPFGNRWPQRGDVIVFHAPASPDEILVKRVVGVPGDLVDAAAGSVRVSGRTLAEPYVMQHAMSGAIAPQIVPAASFFVMGDNRAHSYDSRSWGAVPAELVIGKAKMVLWSSGDADALPNASASTNDRIVASPQHRPRRLFLRIH